MMGGEIGVASEEGKGSIFFFFIKTQLTTKPADEAEIQRSLLLPVTIESVPIALDAELAAPPPSHEAAPEAKPPSASGTKLSNVLIVEDNLINQKVLSKQLKARGYTITVANHGGEALACIYNTASYQSGGTEPTFDVILMDVEMPHMDGLTCVRQIRSLEKGGLLKGHVAIVAVTANVRDEHVKAAVTAGMDAVTTKPYRMEALIQQMEKAYNSNHSDAVGCALPHR
jgi:CheY-like chemotaxis protein